MLGKCIQFGRWVLSGGLFSWVSGKLAPHLTSRIPTVNATEDRRSSKLGQAGEKAAAVFLKRAGYRILEYGHRQKLGEIDLVALDGDCLVFVEVKTWQAGHDMDPSEAVDRRKQEKLTRAALIYLKQKKLLQRPARFDVISIVWPKDGLPSETTGQPKIRHFANAFEAVGNGQWYR